MSGAAQDGPDGFAVPFDGRPAPDVAERADDLQSAPALPRPARSPGRRGLVTGVGDREHHLADPAQQAQPQRARRGRGRRDDLRSGAQPVPDGVHDELGDDEFGVVDEVPQTPASEEFADKLTSGPGSSGTGLSGRLVTAGVSHQAEGTGRYCGGDAGGAGMLTISSSSSGS